MPSGTSRATPRALRRGETSPVPPQRRPDRSSPGRQISRGPLWLILALLICSIGSARAVAANEKPHLNKKSMFGDSLTVPPTSPVPLFSIINYNTLLMTEIENNDVYIRATNEYRSTKRVLIPGMTSITSIVGHLTSPIALLINAAQKKACLIKLSITKYDTEDEKPEVISAISVNCFDSSAPICTNAVIYTTIFYCASNSQISKINAEDESVHPLSISLPGTGNVIMGLEKTGRYMALAMQYGSTKVYAYRMSLNTLDANPPVYLSETQISGAVEFISLIDPIPNNYQNDGVFFIVYKVEIDAVTKQTKSRYAFYDFAKQKLLSDKEFTFLSVEGNTVSHEYSFYRPFRSLNNYAAMFRLDSGKYKMDLVAYSPPITGCGQPGQNPCTETPFITLIQEDFFPADYETLMPGFQPELQYTSISGTKNSIIWLTSDNRLFIDELRICSCDLTPGSFTSSSQCKPSTDYLQCFHPEFIPQGYTYVPPLFDTLEFMPGCLITQDPSNGGCRNCDFSNGYFLDYSENVCTKYEDIPDGKGIDPTTRMVAGPCWDSNCKLCKDDASRCTKCKDPTGPADPRRYILEAVMEDYDQYNCFAEGEVPGTVLSDIDTLISVCSPKKKCLSCTNPEVCDSCASGSIVNPKTGACELPQFNRDGLVFDVDNYKYQVCQAYNCKTCEVSDLNLCSTCLGEGTNTPYYILQYSSSDCFTTANVPVPAASQTLFTLTGNPDTTITTCDHDLLCKACATSADSCSECPTDYSLIIETGSLYKCIYTGGPTTENAPYGRDTANNGVLTGCLASITGCQSCLSNYEQCDLCLNGKFLYYDQIGVMSCADPAAGWGVDISESNAQRTVFRDCQAGLNCKTCSTNYKSCDSCDAQTANKYLFGFVNGDNEKVHACVDVTNGGPNGEIIGDIDNTYAGICIVEGCSNCQTDFATCTQCKADYMSYEGPDNIFRCLKKSDPTPPGIGKVTGQDKYTECESQIHCDTCELDKMSCDSCPDHRFRLSVASGSTYKCVSALTSDIENMGYGTQQSPSPALVSCAQTLNCLGCLKSPDSCDSCAPPRYLFLDPATLKGNCYDESTAEGSGLGKMTVAGDSVLRPCITENCKICVDDYTTCTACKPGYNFKSGACVSRGEDNENNRGFGLDRSATTVEQDMEFKSCLPDPKCLTCRMDNTQCNSCDTNEGLYFDEEQKTCVKLEFDAPSLDFNGYGLKKRDDGMVTIAKCMEGHGCATCSTDYSVCETCTNPDHSVDYTDGKCKLVSADGGSLDLTRTTGYGIDFSTGQRKPCLPAKRCLTCYSNYEFCESCYEGFGLVEGSCRMLPPLTTLPTPTSEEASILFPVSLENVDTDNLDFEIKDQISGLVYHCPRNECYGTKGDTEGMLVLTLKPNFKSLDPEVTITSAKSSRLLATITPHKVPFNPFTEKVNIRGLTLAKLEGGRRTYLGLFITVNALRLISSFTFSALRSSRVFYVTEIFSTMFYLSLVRGPMVTYAERSMGIHTNWYLMVINFGNPFYKWDKTCLDGSEYPSNKIYCNFMTNYGQNWIIIMIILVISILLYFIIRRLRSIQSVPQVSTITSAYEGRIPNRPWYVTATWELSLPYLIGFLDALQLPIVILSLEQFKNCTSSTKMAFGMIVSILFIIYYLIATVYGHLLANRIWKLLSSQSSVSINHDIPLRQLLDFSTIEGGNFYHLLKCHKVPKSELQLLTPVVSLFRVLFISVIVVFFDENNNASCSFLLAFEIIFAWYKYLIHRRSETSIHAVSNMVYSGLTIIYLILRLISISSSLSEHARQNTLGVLMTILTVMFWILCVADIGYEVNQLVSGGKPSTEKMEKIAHNFSVIQRDDTPNQKKLFNLNNKIDKTGKLELLPRAEVATPEVKPSQDVPASKRDDNNHVPDEDKPILLVKYPTKMIHNAQQENSVDEGMSPQLPTKYPLGIIRRDQNERSFLPS